MYKIFRIIMDEIEITTDKKELARLDDQITALQNLSISFEKGDRHNV